MSARRAGRRERRSRRVAPPSAPSLPQEFGARIAELLQEESEAFFAALAAPPAGLRVNTLRLSSTRFQEIAPFAVTSLPYPPDGFLVADDARPGVHPYHAAGLYYLQDPGAMVVGALPALARGARVLDLAAAPGGKATHLAARMGGEGVLVANDVHAGRARELAGNLERCGVRNAMVTSEQPPRLAERWPAWFDLVLVDAPCSGESMFHKSEAARREWSPGAVLGCARRQRELLGDAVRLVRPGGVLLYSTCTFAPEENEMVVGSLLASHPELEIVPLPSIPGGEPGRPEWAGEDADPRLARALRLWPHRFPGAGHFVAALRRGPAGQSDDAVTRATPPGSRSPAADADRLRLLKDFVADSVPGCAPLVGDVVADQDNLYLRPRGAPDLAGLRVLRPGWWLGSTRKGRLEPAHALAMGIGPAEAAEVVELSADEAATRAYLRGDVLRRAGRDGWVLVCVDGFPLGWGRRTGGVVKNHYPKGLRRG